MTKLLLSSNEMRERERKIVHNSAVKIEATKGREMNTSKSGKTASQPTLLLELDVHSLKQNNETQKGGWKALTSFDKNKQIQVGGKVQGGAPVNMNSITLNPRCPYATIECETKNIYLFIY